MSSRLQRANSEARRWNRQQEALRVNRLEARIQELEQSQAQYEEELRAKDRELEAARGREQDLRQQLLDAQQSLADLPNPDDETYSSTTASDSTEATDALVKVITEMQQGRLSKESLTLLIIDAAQEGSFGEPDHSQIESATLKMAQSLNARPIGRSLDQLKKAIDEELEKVVRKIGKQMQPRHVTVAVPEDEHEDERRRSTGPSKRRNHSRYRKSNRNPAPSSTANRRPAAEELRPAVEIASGSTANDAVDRRLAAGEASKKPVKKKKHGSKKPGW